VRYPVEIPHSAEIDEKVTRQLAEVINSAQEVNISVTGMPQIRSAIKTRAPRAAFQLIEGNKVFHYQCSAAYDQRPILQKDPRGIRFLYKREWHSATEING
jgi:hypothetical protein